MSKLVKHRWTNQYASGLPRRGRRAVEDAEDFERQVDELRTSWRQRLGRVRGDSSTALLIDRLPGAPVVTVDRAARSIGRSFQATNQAITRLVEARILRQANLGHRNRAFEAPEVARMFTDLERRPASPVGDTRVAPPDRPVPRRS